MGKLNICIAFLEIGSGVGGSDRVVACVRVSRVANVGGSPCVSMSSLPVESGYDVQWVPIRERNVNYGALDEEVIDHVAGGRLGKRAAYDETRLLVGRSARFMWRCGLCCGVEDGGMSCGAIWRRF
jgi:hypothetical protein